MINPTDQNHHFIIDIKTKIMNALLLKTTFYIIIRYLAFFITITFLNRSFKEVKITDINSGEDIFMLLWLFITPLLLEFLFFLYPISYLIKKYNKQQSVIFILLLIGLFIIEYILYRYFLNIRYSYFKVLTSVFLFIIFYYRTLINGYKYGI